MITVKVELEHLNDKTFRVERTTEGGLKNAKPFELMAYAIFVAYMRAMHDDIEQVDNHNPVIQELAVTKVLPEVLMEFMSDGGSDEVVKATLPTGLSGEEKEAVVKIMRMTMERQEKKGNKCYDH